MDSQILSDVSEQTLQMKICKTIQEMQEECGAVRRSGKRLGFVPTMGALHEGHLSLVRAAKQSCDVVGASIFVNPTQFGPNEDLGKYPQNFERDCALLEREKVEFLFAPTVEEMYPKGAVTWVTVDELSEKLDGRTRPGHFRGVTTVVAKLFHIVQPDAAFFGQKDGAQVAIIRRMVRGSEFSGRNCGVSDCARGGWAGDELAECLSRCGAAEAGAGAASVADAGEEYVGIG